MAGDTLTVVWGGQTVTYTLLAADISGNSATVTVPAGTITTQGDGTFNVTAALTDAVGNASANSSATSVTVDTVAPTAPSITAIPENGGGGINAAEASDGTPVVVGLTGTGAAAGDTLAVNWGSQTVTYTLLAGDISGNSATVTVPLATITAQGQGTFNVTAGLTDIAGNVGSTSTATPATVDTVAPTAAVVITAIATDSGTSSSDFITNDTALTVSGTHGALGPGETVQVSSDGGASWADVTTSTASTWSYTDPTTHGTSFTYQTRIVDSAGNIGANIASQAVIIDTVAPTPPSITSIPENGGGGINAAEASNGTPVVVGLTGTGAAAGDTLTLNWGSQTVTYTLLAADISGNSATVTVPAGTITTQGQGTFNVTAGLTDIAGNVGSNSGAFPVTVDTVAPTAGVAITAIATDSGTSSSDFITNDTTLTVSGTHDLLGSGEKVQVSSDGGASWTDVTTSTATDWSYTDPTLHATSFTYQVRIVDTVGNVGANTAGQAVTIDTVAPAAPSITSIPENGGGGINAGEASNGTPVVVGLAGTGAAAGDTLTVVWGGQTVTYTLLAGDISGNSATVTVTLATLAAQGQGTFDVTARLTDIAGNVGANSTATPVTVDAAAPTATVAITAIATDSGASSSDFITNDTTLTVSGTHGSLGSGEKVQVSSDGGASWADATSTATAWSYIDPTPHGTSFTYQARIVDTVGNVGANTASQAVTIDTVAPTAAVAITAITDDSGTSSSDFITNDTTLTVAGTHGALGPGETVQVSSDGGASWADATSTASTWSYTDPTTHGTSFTYRVRIVDTAGNVDVNTASQAVTIDTAAPAAPSITAIPENGDGGGIDPDEASDGTPVVVGLAGTGAAAGDTLTINWGSQTVNYALLAGDILGNSATVTVPAGTIAAQGLGTFDVTARLTDAAGNASSNSTPISVTVISIDILAPTAAVAITAIATDSGTSSSDFITNDTTLTVSGTHGSLGPGETVQVSSDGGASWFNVTTSTTSTWSYTDPTTHGTSFTYRVRAIDSVGNVGATTSQAVTIDTVAPGAPSITAIPEDGGGGIDAAEALDGTPVVVDLTGTGAVAGDRLTIHWGSQTVNYTLPAGLLASDISGNSATVTVPFATILAQGPGMFDVTATLTDIAGNASSSSRTTSVTVAGGHGDVHMVCFDGLGYDFQAVGDFVAVQSTDAGNPWQVQIRTESFPGATSITTAFAATLGADYVSFAVGRANPVLVDGAPDTLQVGAVQSLAGGTLAHPSANVYQLSWNTGQSATVTDQGGYLDWAVGLGPHDGPGSVRGLLGSNSGPATDFQLPNGTVLAHPSDAEILSVFADAWSVAPGMSLLDETHAPNPALLVQTMAATPSATGAAHESAVAQPGANSDAAGAFLVGVTPLHS